MELNPTIHGLFQVPIWEVDLGRILAEFKPELLVETRAALVERPARNQPFLRQPPTCQHTIPSMQT